MTDDHWPSSSAQAGAGARPGAARTDTSAGTAQRDREVYGDVRAIIPGMAQARKRPKVTLTLDPETRARAEALLDQLPGKTSFSQLVDGLLEDFVETMEPMLAQMKAAAGGDPVAVVRQLVGEQMLKFADAVRDGPRMVEEYMKSDPMYAAMAKTMQEHGPRMEEALRKATENIELPEVHDLTEGMPTEESARAIWEGRKRKE